MAEEEVDDAAVAAVQDTLENLLSKKNLVRDQFLAGNMNPQMYIPIHILLAHERLQAIGATEDLVIVAAERSAKVAVDQDKSKVRPILKSKRNMIILRDIPEGTTEEEVRAIFASGPHADKISTAKPEVNNTWFVKFDLSEGTQEVVLWLKTQKFKGQTVNAAIKSDNFLRSFFPVHPAGVMPHPQQQFPAAGMGGYPPDMMGGQGFDGKGFGGEKGFGKFDGKGKGFDGKGFDGGKGFEPDGKGKGKQKGKGGKGGPPGPPPQPPWMQPSPQPLGYWQPWGTRSDYKTVTPIVVAAGGP